MIGAFARRFWQGLVHLFGFDSCPLPPAVPHQRPRQNSPKVRLDRRPGQDRAPGGPA